MKPKLSPEEIRVLRREVHGKGNLIASKLITITTAGLQWIAQDDERVKAERIKGGGRGGRPVNKKGKTK